MIDPKDYSLLADWQEVRNHPGDEIYLTQFQHSLLKAQNEAAVAVLEWCIDRCRSGMTINMLRKCFHNKLVEISGRGETA